MFCSLYVFDPFQDSTFPFQPFILLESMYFSELFDQVTYIIFIVGKSTPFSILLESLGHKTFLFLEGMLFFLLLLLTQYSPLRYIGRYRAILILMSIFICKM